MHAQERIYLTADKTMAVAAGDSQAAFLYATPGDEIPQSAADVLGIVDGKVKGKVKAEPQPSVPTVVKAGREVKAKSPAKSGAKTGSSAKEMKAPAEDKEDKAGEDKGSDDKGGEEKAGEPDATKPADGAGG